MDVRNVSLTMDLINSRWRPSDSDKSSYRHPGSHKPPKVMTMQREKMQLPSALKIDDYFIITKVTCCAFWNLWFEIFIEQSSCCFQNSNKQKRVKLTSLISWTRILSVFTYVRLHMACSLNMMPILGNIFEIFIGFRRRELRNGNIWSGGSR